MDFKKISKEEWMKLSKTEQDFLTLEFNKSVEERKKRTIVVTRTIAVLCVLVLFFIGIGQILMAQNSSAILEKYGVNGYCYLCGEYATKKCDCIYFDTNFPRDMENYSLELANYNSQVCSLKSTVRTSGVAYDNFIPSTLDFNSSLW